MSRTDPRLSRPEVRRNRPEAKKKTFRPEIQGLRAIAVLSVIADHLFHWPQGGFVGVDIFFVISGFLITSLLLREHEKTGTISFAGFYRRRVKRIMPAAIAVVLAVIIAAYFLFNRARFVSTLVDALFATFFGANWHLAIQGTDYFGATAAVSPLQHYWSLSVEEQFYLVWPWLMLLVYALVAVARGGARHARAIILCAIVLITLASFGWAMWETATNPTWAYFSTFSRAWELGIGAIIAVAAGAFTRIPRWARTTFFFVGLAGIVVSLFVVSDTSGFPAPWAAAPVLSTALVIISGTGGEAQFTRPLANPVASYLGDISYSLYLWHWPAIIFLGVLFPSGDWFYIVLTLVVTAFLSVSSYHLLEDPVRRSQLFEPRKRRRRRRRRSGSSKMPTRTKIGYLVVATVFTAGLVALAVAPHEGGGSATNAGGTPAPLLTIAPSTDAAPSDAMLSDLQQQITAAVSASSWPQLNPTMDDVIANNPGVVATPCTGVNRPSDVDKCSWGSANAKYHIVLVGDSTSGAYLRSFQAITERRSDVRVTTWSMNGCRFSTNVYSNSDPATVAACPGRVDDAISYINSSHPTAVVITNIYSGDFGGTSTAPTDQQWIDGLKKAVDQIKGSTDHVVFLTSSPVGKNLDNCYTPVSKPIDCVSSTTLGTDRNARVPMEKNLASDEGGIFIDSQSFLCAAGKCPSFVGTLPVRRDEYHVSGAYAAYISPLIEHLLIDKNVLPASG